MFCAAALKSPSTQHRKDFQFIKRRQSQNEDHKDWIYLIAVRCDDVKSMRRERERVERLCLCSHLNCFDR